MLGYQAPWWAIVIGALTPPGWAGMFGLGYLLGRRRRDRPDDDDDDRDKVTYYPPRFRRR